MSSPFRSSTRSDSSARSTPSRQTVSRGRTANGYHRPYRDGILDSPSCQLVEELSRIILDDDRNFKKSLDAQAAEQERLHRQALDRSFAYHEEVRQKAERAREKLELEIEQERKRRGEEEKREIEKRRREIAAREAEKRRLQLEDAKRREKERQELEAIRRDKEETERRAEAKRQQDAEEQARVKAAEEMAVAERKAKEEAAAREKVQQAQDSHPPGELPNGEVRAMQRRTSTQLPRPQLASTPAPAQVASAVPGLVSSAEEREALHNRYLDLHKRLKEMRRYVEVECRKQGAQAKEQLSDWRRKLRSYCGQQNKTDKEANKKAMERIREILDKAAQIPEPSVDVSTLIVNPSYDTPQTNEAPTRGPGILVFLLNHLAKSIVRQFIEESSVDTKSADPIGVLAVTVFARPQLLFNGQSLIDILWAKFHKTCPVLFGISGRENSKSGRMRMGWWQEDGAFVDEQKHFSRMTGLAVGFSAITLRDFSKSSNRNPAPNRLWWEALARIVNTPPDQVQATHYIVVKAMTQDYVPRIIQLFGQAGMAALRKALIDFPKYGPRDKDGRMLPAVKAVETLPSVLQMELHLTL